MCSWALVPAGSFKHFINSLNFCTALASWKLFQLCHFDISPLLGLPGRGGTTCSSRALSTVSAQSNPQAPAWAAAVLAKFAVFPLSFYPKQMFSWAFGDVHSTACTLGKNSLPPRWMIIVELYKNIGVFVPFSCSSFGDKVTSLPPRSHQESAWGN